MDFRTPAELPLKQMEIRHSDKMMLWGSCFVEEIGHRLTAYKFPITVNPFGVLYNPWSMAEAMNMLLADRQYRSDELFYSNGLWNSWMHHSSFSSTDRAACLAQINRRLQDAFSVLPQIDVLLCTFGSAWVYELKESGRVVGNCHKQPDVLFRRRLLEVDEIVRRMVSVIDGMRALNPKIRILFTVSPVRHGRDGMHGNQVGKATVLLAVDKMQKQREDCYYFPSYEIMMDELRDYRFYADDMLHPSSLAIDYIWDCFQRCYFSASTLGVMRQWQEIAKRLNHQPFHSHTAAYRRFVNETVLKLNRFGENFPYVDLKKEIEQCRIQLKV